MSSTAPPAWQFGLVAYTPLLTGSLSVMGSSLIICSVLGPGRRELKKLKKPHLRLLLAMSIYDLLYSIPKALTFLLAPTGYGVPGAQGNMTTCRMQGFFIQLAHATGSYNSLLSFYYWLSICRGMTVSTWNRYEPFLHILIFVVFFGLASVGVAIKLYNPAWSWCYIASYPPGCEATPESPPCERFPPQQLGLCYEVFAQMFIQFYFVVVIFTNAAIWYKVRRLEQAAKKYKNPTSRFTNTNRQNSNDVSAVSGGGETTIVNKKSTGNNNHGGNSSSRSLGALFMQRQSTAMESNNNNGGNDDGCEQADAAADTTRMMVNPSDDAHHHQQRRQVRLNRQQRAERSDNNNNNNNNRERMVAIQSFLYTAAFCISWSGPTVFHLVGWITHTSPPFWTAMMIAIFVPLQGFFNCIIYGRPTYIRVRQKFPTLTRWQAVRRVFFSKDPMEGTRISTTTVLRPRPASMPASAQQ